MRVARAIGGSALLPQKSGVIQFSGPEKDEYVKIASRTLSLANQSASISDLGLSEDRLTDLSLKSTVLGDFFSRIHDEIALMQEGVSKLVDQEQCRLWILVVAGNEPDGDVAALTRGAYASIDTERLMSATEANIVAELKKIPEKVGIVGTVLDAKIFHLPVLTANSIIRTFASLTLQQRLTARKFSIGTQNAKAKKDAVERLTKTEFAQVMSGKPTGVRARKKLGSESIAAFDKLSAIAENNDSELNQAIGEALVASGLAVRYELEKDFGQGLSRRTDLIVYTAGGKIRVEIMWRRKTGRADIANYTLSKVFNYARAIGFL